MASRVVSVDLTANPSAFIAGFGRAGAAAEGLDAKTKLLHKNLSTLGGAFVGYEVVKGLVDSTKAAANFQTQITRLKTDANETAGNLKQVSRGVLDLAGATGNTTTSLNAGLYKIESAGIHGADALKVLKAAGEGAKVGQADLTTVADALTTAMTDYHLPATAAVAVTDQLIATVSRGKTTLEALSGSLATVAPAASTAGVGLDQVLGAMATMTAQGTDANKAATYLRQTILQLSNPTAKARVEMEGLGLSSVDVASNLGTRGLTGTFDLLTGAVAKHVQGGTVFIKTLQDASKNTTTWQEVLANLSASQQTAVAALANMTGGTKSLQAVLELTGGNADTFAQNTKDIAAAAKAASEHVTDWGITQGTLNQKIDEAKGSFEKVKIVLGQDLLPVATKIAGWAGDFGDTLGKYPGLVQGVTYAFVGAGGLLLGLKLVNGAFSILQTTWANTARLRGINTATIVAEGAAARSSAASIAALDVAESRVGLRVPIGGALGRLGLAGEAAAGGEATAIGAASVGGVSAAAIGAAMAGPIVAALGGTAFAYYIDQKQKPSTNGLGPVGNAGGVFVPGLGSGIPADTQKMLDNYFKGNTETSVKGLNDDSAAMTRLITDANATSVALQGLNQDSANLNKTADGTAFSIAELAVENKTAAKAADKLWAATKRQVDAFTILNNAGSNAIVTAENYQAALDGMRASVKENGHSLDITTAKGRANTDSIVATANAINDLDTASFNADSASKGHASALQNVTAKLKGQRSALTDQLTSLGYNKTAAKKLVDELLLTPKQVTTKFYSPGLVALQKQLDKANDAINALTGVHQVIVTGSTIANLQSTKNQQVPNGKNAASGYAAGVKAGTGAATDASTAMAKASSDAVAKYNESQSPSKLYKRHGYNTATGLAHGIKDGATKAEREAAALAKKTAAAALASLKFQVKAGTAEALKAYEAGISVLKKKISGEQSILSNLRGNKTSAMAGAKGNITGVADLSAILGTTSTTSNWDGTTTTTTAPVTGAQVRAGLDADAQLAQTFVGHLKQLQQMHYSKPLIDQILGMGPVAGDAFAVAILSLGAGGVAGINGDFASINQSGNVAASMAGAPYQAGIDKQVAAIEKNTAVLERMEKTKAEVTLIIKQEGKPGIDAAGLDAIATAVEKKLGLKVNLKGRSG